MRPPRFVSIVLCMILGLLAVAHSDSVDVKVKKSETKVKTRYDISGRPVNQGQNLKGFHRVVGSCKLVSGIYTVTLNSSTAESRQDISFTNATTYSGRAWTLNVADRSKIYSVKPISGIKFNVVSSDTADTATVQFEVEGE